MAAQFQGLKFELEYPHSVGVYDQYEDAQKAVDFLADQKFPVENLAIVGTDLKLVERVTGRKNWGSVLTQSVLTGISTGLLVGILVALFSPEGQFLPMLLVALGIAIVLNVIFGAAIYAMSGGRRDFNSVRTTIPSKYEILCEHKHAAQAREKLLGMPGARATLFE
ncbi:general stress protein [Granulicoccus sp. GXG6511]|uniref:general stress protein n=1 Tax=Granulicoccus sp. GXG6511 TaxID=3381351 RepID=UPI003D7E6675